MRKLFAALFLVSLLLATQNLAPTRAASCSNTQFQVTNVIWGTPGSPMQVQPGDMGVPLSVSLLYLGSCPIQTGSFTLGLPLGFTAANPQAGTTLYLANVPAYSPINLQFNLNLAPQPQLNVGNWLTSSLSIAFTPDGSTYYYSAANIGIQVLGRASLTFDVSPRSLVAGQVNNLLLTIRNNGTGGSTNVVTSVSSPGPLSVLRSVPEASAIPAGSAYTRNLDVFVPGLAAGQSLSLVFSSTYVDPYSNTRVITQTIGMYSPSGPESVNLNIIQSQANLVAGQITTVKITIQNSGSGDAKNLTISIGPSQYASVLNLPPRIPLLSSSSEVSFPLQIFASSPTAGTAISLGFAVTYQDPYSLTRVYSQNVGFYSSNNSPVQLQFSALTPQLSPGNTSRVAVLVSNIGTGTALNVSLAFSASASVLAGPTASVLSAPSTVGLLPGHSSTTALVEIFTPVSAAGQSITLSVTATYTDSTGNSRVASGQVGLYVASVYALNNIGLSGYSYQPTLIFPGTTVCSLQVVLANLGTAPASNLSVSLVPSKPVYAISAGSLTRTFGLFPAGQTIPVTFQLGIRNSTEPLNSTLTLLVQSSGPSPEQFSIPFNEQPEADFAIVSSSVPQISSGDGADQLTVTLRNTGHAAAQLATFTMQPSHVFGASTSGSFTTSANAGVGTVAPGALVNLTVVIQVNSNILPGSYPLVFHSTWTQLGASQPFSQDIRLTLPVHASTFQVANGIITGIPFLAALVILIVALVAYRRVRSRARRRASESSNQTPKD